MIAEYQQKFAEASFIKDGCSPEEAKKETWASMVEHLFDGNEAEAINQFHLSERAKWE